MRRQHGVEGPVDALHDPPEVALVAARVGARREAPGHGGVGHQDTGGQQGVATILAMLPREGAVVAIMANLERAQLRELSTRVLRVLAGIGDGTAAAGTIQRNR